MKTQHIYTVQAGDEVLARNVGTEVPVTEYTTAAEALANGQFENEAAIMQAANSQRRIKQNIAVRAVLSKEDGTLQAAIAAAEAVVYKAPRPKGEGKPKGSGEIVKAKTVAKRVDSNLVRLLREGKDRDIANAVKSGWITEADVEAARGALAAETVTAPQA